MNSEEGSPPPILPEDVLVKLFAAHSPTDRIVRVVIERNEHPSCHYAYVFTLQKDGTLHGVYIDFSCFAGREAGSSEFTHKPLLSLMSDRALDLISNDVIQRVIVRAVQVLDFTDNFLIKETASILQKTRGILTKSGTITPEQELTQQIAQNLGDTLPILCAMTSEQRADIFKRAQEMHTQVQAQTRKKSSPSERRDKRRNREKE